MTTAQQGLPRPCDPGTLGDECRGTCGRRLHFNRAGAAGKARCADGHPVHDGHRRCSNCNQAARRSQQVSLDWQEQAACRGADPGLFFPRVPAGTSFQQAVEPVAWRYCHGCPVRDECDGYAEATRSLGLWAGVWRRYRGTRYIRTPVIPAAARERAS